MVPQGIAGIAYVENNDEQEVDIRNVVELQPDVLWNKCQRSVFGGSNLVPGVGDFQVAFFISFRLWYRDVEVNRSIWVGIGGFLAVGGRILGWRAARSI